METSVVALIAGASGLLLGVWLTALVRRTSERRRARAHNERGQRAERDAERLLEAEGYTIVSRQLRTAYDIQLGDGPQEVPLIIDFVVERRGERLAAEVKSGIAATRLEHAETRRQLLEYQLALGCSRTLLVDPERARIVEVSFPIPRPSGARRSIAPLVAALALAMLILGALGMFFALQPR